MKDCMLYIQSIMLRSKMIDMRGIAHIAFDTDRPDWREHLIALDGAAQGEKPFIIASIQVCRFIVNNCPTLARGVVANHELTNFSASMMAVPADLRLNRRFIMLPFADIAPNAEMLTDIFGRHLFIRPESGAKSFAGFMARSHELDQEISSVRQISHTQDHELCIIAADLPIRELEYRSWLIDGKVAAITTYSHNNALHASVPDNVVQTAQRTAQILMDREDAIVADFAVISGTDEVKLIELNNISTSGIYAHADVKNIVVEMGKLLI